MEIFFSRPLCSILKVLNICHCQKKATLWQEKPLHGKELHQAGFFKLWTFLQKCQFTAFPYLEERGHVKNQLIPTNWVKFHVCYLELLLRKFFCWYRVKAKVLCGQFPYDPHVLFSLFGSLLGFVQAAGAALPLSIFACWWFACKWWWNCAIITQEGQKTLYCQQWYKKGQATCQRQSIVACCRVPRRSK